MGGLHPLSCAEGAPLYSTIRVPKAPLVQNVQTISAALDDRGRTPEACQPQLKSLRRLLAKPKGVVRRQRRGCEAEGRAQRFQLPTTTLLGRRPSLFA